MARTHIFMAGIIIPGLLYFAPAIASEVSKPVTSPADAAVPQDVASPDSMSPEMPFVGTAVVDDTTLEAAKGMADLKVIDQTVNAKNTATVSGNIINGDFTTGTISIDGASFGNFNGMALVTANTGNNVSINSAMNVNVAIQ
ncbi:MAG: hypothetical protein ABWZ75_07525 [Novosphingobium sp.]